MGSHIKIFTHKLEKCDENTVHCKSSSDSRGEDNCKSLSNSMDISSRVPWELAQALIVFSILLITWMLNKEMYLLFKHIQDTAETEQLPQSKYTGYILGHMLGQVWPPYFSVKVQTNRRVCLPNWLQRSSQCPLTVFDPAFLLKLCLHLPRSLLDPMIFVDSAVIFISCEMEGERRNLIKLLDR